MWLKMQARVAEILQTNTPARVYEFVQSGVP